VFHVYSSAAGIHTNLPGCLLARLLGLQCNRISDLLSMIVFLITLGLGLSQLRFGLRPFGKVSAPVSFIWHRCYRAKAGETSDLLLADLGLHGWLHLTVAANHEFR
jgi:hypothetical protein